MTPFQTYGQTSAPSNMMFPTAAYLQAAGNAADLQMKGMDAIGRGIAGGIEKASNLMEAHKEEQAKYNATKKMFDAFSGYLDESQKENIKNIFDDTTMSVKQKNALAPLLMNFLSQAQQQYGKERIANIMTNSREAIAAARNPSRPERPAFNVASTIDPLDQVIDQAPVAPTSTVPYMLQRPQGQPQPTQGSLSSMPKTKLNPQTGKMQFWSPEAKRYIDEPEDDLVFGTDFRIQ